MAPPLTEQKQVFFKSGNRCAFEQCRRLLTARDGGGRSVVLGEIAHIVGESDKGPRGKSPIALAERNLNPNLMALCNRHHQLIDAKPEIYTVERLRGMKEDHERWVEETLGPTDEAEPEIAAPVTETVHATLLPVEVMPRFVFGIDYAGTDERAVAKLLRPLRGEEMAPFIVRGGKLWTFQDLGDTHGPFADLVNGEVLRASSQIWWDDPDRARWFVDLLNRSLNKLTGRRDLQLDRAHHRYYFAPYVPGKPRALRYQSLNGRLVHKNVVWRRISKTTGEERGYWFHRAVAMRFHRIGPDNWVLALRPEFYLTIDGVRQPKATKIGARVTRRKSRMFNHVVLGEVQLWRDYLSGARPRITLPFGAQHLVVSSTLMRSQVTWPGIPEEHAQPFRNVEFMEDLWSWGEQASIESAESQLDLLEEDQVDSEEGGGDAEEPTAP